MKRVFLFAVFFALLFSCKPELIIKGPKYDYSKMEERVVELHKKIELFVYNALQTEKPLKLHPATRIDSLIIDDKNLLITIDFSKHFSWTPMREDNVTQVYKHIRELPGKKYRRYALLVRSLGYPIQDLIPNFYRSGKEDYDLRRLPLKDKKRPLPLVRPERPWRAIRGLNEKNIALWHSHGWYYNQTSKRWEWQRPRLFQSVEDLLPTSFMLSYLIPMLENAGANVFVPRERDIQTNMVVVDNDSISGAGSSYSEWSENNEHLWQTGAHSGFGEGNPPYGDGVNPFKLGSYRQTLTDTVASAGIAWTPDIPEAGRYAVYISFHASAENTDEARYTVYHRGGKSAFLVNQKISGCTWIYLGTFSFGQGVHPDSGSVRLSNLSLKKNSLVSADAVRFGGGMGNILRGGSTSGRPRFVEAARYNLQYAGMPDTLVYTTSDGENDYKDDYQGRGEWANYLKGAPYGPNKDRLLKGLGVPVDLSFAFHTDAGISSNDTTIGTLAIYSIFDADTQQVFPDSVSRLANRDLADLVQSQLVHDLRALHDPSWTRRQLMNADYSETFRPNMPSMILELLSHQNYLDMQFALDPRFRFTSARAIYKAMLKFLATEYDYPYQVQPLPVTHFSALFDTAGNLQLNWRPQNDTLEPTAAAEKYAIYIRRGDADFNLAKMVAEPRALFKNLVPGLIYSFKVCAVNEGGASFPSEILSVCKTNNAAKPVLIINGFDRVSGPAVFSWGEHSGFLNEEDNGVPDRFDVGFTGAQFDFANRSPFILNDAPGHGASYADFETRVIPGNTFDFPKIHGQAILAAGYPFVSCSDEAVEDSLVDLQEFLTVDLILGEEKETKYQKQVMDSLYGTCFKAFPEAMQKQLALFTESGGRLLVSGAYVGTDLFAGKDKTHADVKFARNVLRVQWATNHAARRGELFWNADSTHSRDERLSFNQRYDPQLYTVEAPDALNPVNGSRTVLRYRENEFSAAVAYSGKYKTVVMGFPFEAILSEAQRNELMNWILEFFER